MTNFSKWFIGFIDAEGNFQLFSKVRKDKNGNITRYGIGYGFHIGLSIRDTALLEYIQYELQGLGKIYNYTGKEEVHYAITRKKELLQFINLVLSEHSLLTSHQYKRFINLKRVLEQGPVSVKTMDDYNNIITSVLAQPDPFSSIHKHINEWIVGFVNGEGSFGVYRDGRIFRFSVEHTDKDVLELLRNTINLDVPVITRSIRENRKPTFIVSVSSVQDITKVVAFFDKNELLKGYKQEQYNTFRNKWFNKNMQV